MSGVAGKSGVYEHKPLSDKVRKKIWEGYRNWLKKSDSSKLKEVPYMGFDIER